MSKSLRSRIWRARPWSAVKRTRGAGGLHIVCWYWLLKKEYADPGAASIVPYRSYKTLDGDILFGGGNDRLFGVLSDRLQRPEWKTDDRFVTNSARVKNRHEIDGMIEEITKQKTTQEWLEIFEGSGMPYSAVNDIQGTLNHKHGEMKNDKFGQQKLISVLFL
jgi:crotonobetainyl-CoA:carnitine CoA-transferase CaiB-like acyl-CoA transferase